MITDPLFIVSAIAALVVIIALLIGGRRKPDQGR